MDILEKILFSPLGGAEHLSAWSTTLRGGRALLVVMLEVLSDSERICEV
jgi:hypothetical protein